MSLSFTVAQIQHRKQAGESKVPQFLLHIFGNRDCTGHHCWYTVVAIQYTRMCCYTHTPESLSLSVLSNNEGIE